MAGDELRRLAGRLLRAVIAAGTAGSLVAQTPTPLTADAGVSPPDIQAADRTALEPDIPLEVLAEVYGGGLSRAVPILGALVRPGEKQRLKWNAGESFAGQSVEIPVTVIHGAKPGLTLCLTAAIHGDELNGVEIVRRLLNGIVPEELSGTIIGVPIVNLLGFTRGSRYLPDRRDLNRNFPGTRNGSSAARIAFRFFENVVRRCDRLVDFHTGSMNRTNLPQLRADLNDSSVLEFTAAFGSTPVLHKVGTLGNLRTAAARAGIPAVTFELGEPLTLQADHIEFGIKVMETALNSLGMTKNFPRRRDRQPVYYSTRWIRVDNGGLLTTRVPVGARVEPGTLLGVVVNPFTDERFDILSPYRGRVMGMSLNQFMLPGYAAFNIGIATDEPHSIIEAQTFECIGTDVDPAQIDDEFDCSADLREDGMPDDADVD